MTDHKKLTQQRFGDYAKGYVNSPGHSNKQNLDYLVEITQPQPNWRVLDVATGGGHTALRFASEVETVIAVDLTEPMLEAARTHITEQDTSNVVYAASEAEHLALPPSTFDLVTCRIAPHHFEDVFRFMRECARVLKPSGLLVIQDQIAPDDPKDGYYLDAFQRLRDPSHKKTYAAYEWEGMFLDAGFTVLSQVVVPSTVKLREWALRQGATEATIQKMQILLTQAPEGVKAFIRPQHPGTDLATFDHNYLIMLGRKQ